MSEPPRQIYTSDKSRRDLDEPSACPPHALATLMTAAVAVVIVAILSLV